jgi:hypothetical protein
VISKAVISSRTLSALFLLLGFISVLSARAQDPKQEDLASALVYLEGREIRKLTTNTEEYEVWLKHPSKVLLEPDWVLYSGTGFLVEREDVPYLVTAAHVARRMDFWAQVSIRGAGAKPVAVSLLELCGSADTVPWLYHVEADVAVLRLKPSERIQKDVEMHLLPYEWIAVQTKAPRAGSVLTAIGFSTGLGAKERFPPISADFKALSELIRYPRFDTGRETTFFFLDKPALSGFSGAPVFEGLARKPRLIGLVYGTVSDTAGGGFSAVVPSVFIAETLEGASDLRPSN